MTNRLFILAALNLLSISQVLAQVGKMLPVDDSVRDPSLALFVRQFINAVTTEDTLFLWKSIDTNAYIDPDIHGLASVQDFYRKAKVHVLQNVTKPLLLGGRLSEDGQKYVAPYTLHGFPADLDPYEHLIITGESVNVRETPSRSGKIIRQLSYDIVKTSDAPSRRDSLGYYWVAVTLADTTRGYVLDRFIVRSRGCGVTLRKRFGQWRLASWGCGD